MPEVAVRELTMAEAVREALSEEMRRDPTVFIMGEDVAEAGTPFKVLSGMVEEFGKSRVIDTPISEPGFTGIGVGAAMTGLRPVVDIMFGDFLTLVMDQLVNQAAKVHYMSGEGALYVRRRVEGADSAADDAGSVAPLGRAALAIAARVAQPRSGSESGFAVDALRCQGIAENSHSRR